MAMSSHTIIMGLSRPKKSKRVSTIVTLASKPRKKGQELAVACMIC